MEFQLDQKLSTMPLFRTAYPEVKRLLAELGRSRGNMIITGPLSAGVQPCNDGDPQNGRGCSPFPAISSGSQ